MNVGGAWDPAVPRVAATFGFVATVVLIAAVVFGSQIAMSSDDVARTVREIAQHRVAAEASAWLFALGLLTLVPFFLGLAATLSGRFSAFGWAGATLLVTASVMNAPANLAPFVIAHNLGAGIREGNPTSQTVGEGLLGMFQVVDSMSHAVLAVGAVLLATGMAADGRCPRWLPAVLAAAALAMLLFSVSLAVPALQSAIIVGSALFLIWIVGSSLWLLRVARTAAPG